MSEVPYVIHLTSSRLRMIGPRLNVKMFFSVYVHITYSESTSSTIGAREPHHATRAAERTENRDDVSVYSFLRANQHTRAHKNVLRIRIPREEIQPFGTVRYRYPRSRSKFNQLHALLSNKRLFALRSIVLVALV